MTKIKSCGEYYKGQKQGKSTSHIELTEENNDYRYRYRKTKTNQIVNQICETGKKLFEEKVKSPEDAYYTEEKALCAIEFTSYTKNMRYQQ